MPIGSHHRETGLLMLERGTPVLVRDDGGRWRLERSRAVEKLIGRRVDVEGVRAEFDLLTVEAIACAGEPLRRRKVADVRYVAAGMIAIVAVALAIPIIVGR